MSRSGVLVGDPTTTGGTVLTGDPFMTVDGRAVARWGDTASCRACKSVGKITGHAFPIQKVNGRAIARHGDIVLCQCPKKPTVIGTSGPTWTIADDVGGQQPGSLAPSTHTPAGSPIFDQHAHVIDQLSGEPLAGARYRLEWSGGSVEGVTSATGHTERISAEQAETAVIHILSDNE